MSIALERPRALVLAPVLAVLAGCGGNSSFTDVLVPNAVAVADFNGDGRPDVAVASAQIDETGLTQKPGILGIMLQGASGGIGNFGSQVAYDASPVPPSGLVVGDLTGTGTQDAVVANNANGTLSVFLQTGHNTGRFNSPLTVTVGGQPNDVQLADINGDGLPDLVVADGTGKIEILLQDPANPGHFGAPTTLTIPPPTSAGTRGISVAVADLNGDGLPDLAVTSSDPTSQTSVGGTNGALTIFFQDPAHPGTFLANPTQITVLGQPTQVKIADLNGDGLPDIAIACQGLGLDTGTAGAMILLNTPGNPGTFGTPTLYGTTTVSLYAGTASLDIGDLTNANDDTRDIAMASRYPEGQGTIFVLPHDPANPGQFLPPSVYSGLGQPVAVVIHDMDGDGLNDLVVADSSAAGILYNSTTAPGTFVAEVQIGF